MGNSEHLQGRAAVSPIVPTLAASRAMLRGIAKRLLERMLGSSNYAVLRVMLGRFDDFSGYEKLIDYIEANGIGKLKGDFLEIGAFMGGGSAKLARCARRYGKKLIVIDLFDPSFDSTETADGGGPLNSQYQQILGRKNQREAF